MLVCLGIDSQFAMVEVVITSVKDAFEHTLSTKKVRHEVVVLIVCVFSFCCGLPNLFQGGIYFFQVRNSQPGLVHNNLSKAFFSSDF